MVFTLPPASARRIAESIRQELVEKKFIGRLIIRAPESVWALVDGKVVFGREVLDVTSSDALFSLARRICRDRPAPLEKNLMSWHKKLTRRERAFIVYVAREAQELGLWLCDASPQKLVFWCAPSIHRVSTIFPPALIEFVLGRLDACV
jgi:hypothetical protein